VSILTWLSLWRSIFVSNGFSIFPPVGVGAEVYPPESADMALVPGRIGERSFDYGLLPVSEALCYSAFLIANKDSWETKDMSEVLASLEDKPAIAPDKNAPLQWW